MMTVIGPVRSAVVIVTLGKDEDVVAAAERILEDGSRAQVDVRIMARSLVGGGTIEVPNAELADVGDLLAHGLRVPMRSILRNQMALQPLRAELTVVFERRPPSPSIHTSG
jgi:hypothetical protein